MVSASQSTLLGTQSPEIPRGLWATQACLLEGREESAGRKKGGVKKGHLGKEREEKRESKRTVACFSSH